MEGATSPDRNGFREAAALILLIWTANPIFRATETTRSSRPILECAPPPKSTQWHFEAVLIAAEILA